MVEGVNRGMDVRFKKKISFMFSVQNLSGKILNSFKDFPPKVFLEHCSTNEEKIDLSSPSFLDTFRR